MPLVGKQPLHPAQSTYNSSQQTWGGPSLGPFSTVKAAEVKTGNNNLIDILYGQQIGVVHCYATSIGFEEYWVLFDLNAFQATLSGNSLRVEWAGSATLPWGPALRQQHRANAQAEGRPYYWFGVSYSYKPAPSLPASPQGEGHYLQIAGVEQGRMVHLEDSQTQKRSQHWVLHPGFDTPTNGTPFEQVHAGGQSPSWALSGAPTGSLYVYVSWKDYALL